MVLWSHCTSCKFAILLIVPLTICHFRKREKENVHSETLRCSKLRSANADLLSKNQRQAFEIEKLTERLDKYDAMSPQDELQTRVKDLENDISQLKETIRMLESENSSLNERIAVTDVQHNQLQDVIIERDKAFEEINQKVH